VPSLGKGEEQARWLTEKYFDEEQEYRDLIAASVLPLLREFFSGVSTEFEQHEDLPRKSTKQQLGTPDLGPGTEELLRLLDETGLSLEEILAIVGRPQMPPEMLVAALDAMKESFEQEYWKKISQTTRSDVQRVLAREINGGLPVREIAKQIQEFKTETGEPYDKYRARTVARTETGHMMNSGHSSGIDQLAADTGLDIRKEWLSVLGSTTRESHAATDGQISDKDGMFDLSGYRVPWPSHFSLPVSERANCQCTVMSVLMMDDEI
jgi:hypothetical protein